MRDRLRRAAIPLVVVAWALAVSGCGLWPIRAEDDAAGTATLPELVALIESRTSELASLRALIAVEAGGGRPFMASMSWARPESLRVTGLSAFGTPLFAVTVSGGWVEWSSPDDAPVILGSVHSLKETSPVDRKGMPVSVEDLVLMLQALTGPVLDEDEAPVLEHGRRNDLIHAVRTDSGRTRLTKRFYVDRRSRRLVREDLFGPDGSVRLSLRFEEYRETAQGPWPHRIEVQAREKGLKIALVFREFQFNPDLPREEFLLRAQGAS